MRTCTWGFSRRADQLITGVADEAQKAALTDFISSILGTVDGDNFAKRRPLETAPENGQDFEKKFREYEERIEALRDQLEKQTKTLHIMEERLLNATDMLREERETNRKLMLTINEILEATQREMLKEQEVLQHTAAMDLQLRKDEIADLRDQLNTARAVSVEADTQRKAAEARLAETQGRMAHYEMNWVRKEEWDRLFEEKTQRENRFAEAENRLAIEMAKSAMFEAQIEKFKLQSRGQAETEGKLRLEVDQLSARVVALNNEVRMPHTNRKGSMAGPDEHRSSGNLEMFDESGFLPICFSRVDEEMGRRAEEVERAHREVEANLKAKVEELLATNEALNRKLLRVKDENNSIKADSSVLKKSSLLALSQREVSKVRRNELSEEMVDRLLNYEMLNKRLKEEAALLQGRLMEATRAAAAANGLVYSAVLGYLS